MRARLVVMASGAGSTLEAMVLAAESGKLSAEVVGVILSRVELGAERIANEHGIESRVLDPRDFATSSAWDEAMLAQLQKWYPDWIALAGYTRKIGRRVLEEFAGRMINTHPSLLPRHGGQGMYGLKVHAAVLAANEKVSGVTIHFVEDEYDSGQILAQAEVAVMPNDSPETLAARVKAKEKILYVNTLEKLITTGLESPSASGHSSPRSNH